MSVPVKYHSLLCCQVTNEMHAWYHAEAARRGTIYKRVPASDVMREALQLYIEHVDKANLFSE